MTESSASAGETNGSLVQRGGGRYARRKNLDAHCGRIRSGSTRAILSS